MSALQRAVALAQERHRAVRVGQDLRLHGVGPGNEPFEVDVGTVRATLETNTLGPLQLSQTLAPLMIVRRYGRIVNVTSGYGQMDSMTSRMLAYKISKLALNGITRILADELRGSGVLVNAVDPGWVRTDMGGAGAPRSVSRGADTAVFLAMLPDGGPTGRLFRDRREVPW